MKVTELKGWESNPRTITDDELAGLGVSMEQFGDISGVVFNSRNDRLVCGHQRIKSLKALYGDDLEVEEVDSERGVIRTEDGKEWSVRFVDWDEETHAAACIAGNSEVIQGKWDEGLLGTLLQDINAADADLFSAMRIDKLAELHCGMFDVDSTDMPELNANEPTHQKMAFILSNEQAEAVKSAIETAKQEGPFIDTGNENSNGNALTRVAERYVGTREEYHSETNIVQ